MVSLGNYLRRLDVVDIQFRFFRYAISALSKSKKLGFYRSLTSEGLVQHQQSLASLKEKISEPEFAALKETEKESERRLRKKFSRKNQRWYDEFFEDGLNALELLIRVAHFEAFMKDVHLEVLRAEPTLLGKIRPKREIKYEDVFKEGVTATAFHEQEFHREVEELDRKRIRERADYFHKHLQLSWSWCDDVQIELLEDIMDWRNKISHETPNLPVPKSFLDRAANLLKMIPTLCIIEAQERYKGHFK